MISWKCALGWGAVALAVTGCASQPIGVSSALMAQWHTRGLVVAPVEDARTVQVKSKGQAVFGMVAGTVVGSAVAASEHPLNVMELQQAQQVGLQANAVVQQAVADYTRALAQAETPGQAMGLDLSMRLLGMGIPHTAQSYRVVITQSTWLLSYDSLFGSDNYRLHYALETEVVNADDDTVTSATCKGQGDTVQALDVWKANDYAPVKAYARQVGRDCVTQLLGDLGLHG